MTQPLDHAHTVFLEWFGANYDLAAIDAVLATRAAEHLNGEAPWLLVISGSGNAKTETVSSLSADALITSTITSEGALLSASAQRERAKDAHGGLLRRIGSSGMLVIKDVTSLLSMDRNIRASVLAALREVADGFWERNVGTEGGRTLTWKGRIGVVGACTTAWDRAHDVIASMGDRFVTVRMDSSDTTGRTAAGRRAMRNTGDEGRMRKALARAVATVIEAASRKADKPNAEEATLLLDAADLVTRCRTGVDYDYSGKIIDAHALEMPTRFVKQLVQVLRGASAIGMARPAALELALRCARDSMPPLRLAILEDVAANPGTRTKDVRYRLNKPYNTVDRQLQALHMLGALDCDELATTGRDGQERSSWYYSVAKNINVKALAVPEMLVRGFTGLEERDVTLSNKSGTEHPDLLGKSRDEPTDEPDLRDEHGAAKEWPSDKRTH